MTGRRSILGRFGPPRRRPPQGLPAQRRPPRLLGRRWSPVCPTPRAARWASRVGLLALAGGAWSARVARAQTLPPGPSLAPSTAAGSGVDGLVGLDTTLRPGRQDFTPYRTPGGCVAAARATEALTRRADPDSAAYAPEHDTLTHVAVAVARRCGTAFTVTTVAPAELLDFAQLALLRGDDSTAYAAAERYVAGQGDPAAQRWALYAADTMYLNARPMRRAAAEAVTAQLDALGPAAALQRKLAHAGLLDDAQRRYDVERLRREVLALLAACHQQSASDSLDVEGGSCVEASLVLQLFFAELYRDTAGAIGRTQRLVSTTGFTDWATFNALMRGVHLDWIVEQMGKPLPPLAADQWSGARGRAPGWPVRGKASLFLHADAQVDDAATMAKWKRLGEEFKDALDITVLVVARGFFAADNRMPGAGAQRLTPAEEAERVGRFYREQLGVPVTVALVERPVWQQLPLPDGRTLRGEPAFTTHPYYSQSFLLADRTGKFLLGGGLDLPEPAMWAWVARAVGR